MSGRALARVLAAAWLAAASTAAAAASVADTPVIDVIGRRREGERLDRPGQTSVLRPEDATRFDTRALLEREPSLALPETGRINASGFAVPRIRGQDTRMTEIYLDDLLLQDPYGGLPLVDELDLRAFGELVLHQGLPPPELPSVSPIGALQYRQRPVKAPRVTLGGAAGRPYGTSSWVLGEYRRGDAFAFRGYAREHRTSGAYRYYDDNATPYNATDDRYAVRSGNHRASRQILPHFTLTDGASTYKAFALWGDARTGLPAPRGDAHADEYATSNAGAARWTRRFGEPVATALGVAATEDARDTEDPSGAVLGPRGSARIKVSTRKADAGFAWHAETAPAATALALTAEAARARVRAATGDARRTELERESLAAHLGLAADLGARRAWTVELKGQVRRHDDAFAARDQGDLLGVPAAAERRLTTRGFGAALGWRSAPLALYAQAARLERPPSLLEEFGDGGLVRGQPDLRPERVRHLELGSRVRAFGDAMRLGLAGFEDRVEDRVVFVPALGASVRALNLARTRVRGAELSADARYEDTHLVLGYTRLYPLDLTLPRRERVLPAVPEHVAVAAVDQGIGPVTLRWGARHQGRVFRDVDNAITVPAYTVHDASADARWPAFGAELQAGLALLNVFDVARLPIEAPGTTGSRGYTSYSDLDGYPLPGRQWRLTAAASF